MARAQTFHRDDVRDDAAGAGGPGSCGFATSAAEGAESLSLSEAEEFEAGREKEVLDLDCALGRLAQGSPRKAKPVEFRYFGGLTIEEIAEVLGMSVATAERDWRVSRAFLRRELGCPEPA